MGRLTCSPFESAVNFTDISEINSTKIHYCSCNRIHFFRRHIYESYLKL